MARYFAPGEALTYDDFLTLRAELFDDLETYLHEKYNIFDRVDELVYGANEADKQIEKIEERLDALEDADEATA